MNGYNFTDRVRKVLQMSREEAASLRHEYVDTEHLLLGLIREGEGVATAVLVNLKVDLEEVRRKVEKAVKKGRTTPAGPDLPYTSRAKKVLELAMSETHELRHSYVGTEHLLLGLLREEKGVAAQVLNYVGVTLEQARAETVRLLASQMPGQMVVPEGVAGQVAQGRARVLGRRRRAEIHRQMVSLVEPLLAQPQSADVQRAAQTLRALLEELHSLEQDDSQRDTGE